MGVSPQYFLDEMGMWELDAILNAYNIQYRQGWEHVRSICYYITCAASTSKVKIKEIMPFPWDEEETKPKSEPMTKEDRELLMKRSEGIKLKLFGKKE